MTNKITVNIRSADGNLVAERSIDANKIVAAAIITYRGKFYIYKPHQHSFSVTYATFIEVNDPVEII